MTESVPISTTNDATQSPAPVDQSTPFCFATVVVDKALESLLASGTEAILKDDHPWIVAEQFFAQATQQGLRVPILLAVQDEAATTCEFSHWAYINAIDVLELSGKRFMSQVQLGALSEISPLFTALDSVSVKPADEQLYREDVEGVRTQRVALVEHYLRPYAICESPGFIPRQTPWLYQTPRV